MNDFHKEDNELKNQQITRKLEYYIVLRVRVRVECVWL